MKEFLQKNYRLAITAAVLLAIVGLKAVSQVSLQTDPQSYPLTTPEPDQISVNTSSEGDSTAVETELEQEAGNICRTHTCIGTVELQQGETFVPLEGEEINISPDQISTFRLTGEDKPTVPYRIRFDVYDEKVRIISSFYSNLITP